MVVTSLRIGTVFLWFLSSVFLDLYEFSFENFQYKPHSVSNHSGFLCFFSGGFSSHPIRCISPQVKHMGETPSPVISPNHSSHRLFLKIASRGAGFALGGVPPDPSRGAPPSTLSGWVSAMKFPSFRGLQRSLPPCDVLEDVARLEAKPTFFGQKKCVVK